MGIYEEIQERMAIEFETKYIGGKRFEICWKGQKYELQTIEQEGNFWIEFPLSNLFLNKINKELIDEIMELSLSNLSLTRIFSNYLATEYKQTMEYKMRKIYN